jgi:hypothetical protein
VTSCPPATRDEARLSPTLPPPIITIYIILHQLKFSLIK